MNKTRIENEIMERITCKYAEREASEELAVEINEWLKKTNDENGVNYVAKFFKDDILFFKIEVKKWRKTTKVILKKGAKNNE